MNTWQFFVNIFSTLGMFFWGFSILLLLLWLILYILKEKYILPERYLYKIIRATALLMIILLAGSIICFFGKEHYQDKIDEKKSIEKALEEME
ncbi:hypothetical protein D3233_10065 [Staphylococcus aureus]|uniref:Uncharacterized protein n=1 Tax=Staphylococcus agnetis TaxID=985762 RepID=A0ABX3Z0J8_9STAP|nr:MULTISPECIES: hypothetical protein [Staphylococcus]ALN77500.1 hypothetical protein EP23_09125 [Staphylococcus agnetis]EZT66061.1 hypothetical protein U885_01885 [Staphylococcus aureus 81629]EZU38019.1 hypothetical protein U918_02707 [Staphylococcus aureus 10S01493]EZU94802.1 hypothetical protein U920_02532 [Staphylococcus aureus 11S00627]EZV18999.1 hypothetical protein U926_01569 [Staphylococcus aureus 12S00881]